MNEKISVIIPVYNREQYIEECIDSLQKQTYQNLEILLIDDGSTDSTVEICTKLANNDPRIVLLKGEHGGVSKARNKGLDAATGKYVFFLDSDDLIHPFLLETFIESMKNSDATIAGTNVTTAIETVFHNAQHKIGEACGLGSTSYQNYEASLRAVFYGPSPLSGIGGTMFCRDLIGQTKFRTDLILGEDAYFIYENLIKGASTIFLKEVWYYYRIHSNNSSSNYGYDAFRSLFLRRKLVADSEESFGRLEYAKTQRRSAFNTYLRYSKKNRPYSLNARKIRKIVRTHKKELFSALNAREKVFYYFSMYLPFTFNVATRTWQKLRHNN